MNWPESSGLGNVVDFVLATKKDLFLTQLGNFKQKFFGSVANQKSPALHRGDDSGQ